MSNDQGAASSSQPAVDARDGDANYGEKTHSHPIARSGIFMDDPYDNVMAADSDEYEDAERCYESDGPSFAPRSLIFDRVMKKNCVLYVGVFGIPYVLIGNPGFI